MTPLSRRIILCICLIVPLPLAAANTAESNRPLLTERVEAQSRAITDQLSGLPKTGTVLGALMFYDPGEDLAGAYRGEAYGPGDRAFVEAALAVYDLYRQIGGERPKRIQLFRQSKGQFHIGVESGAGHWFQTADKALGHYFARLVGASQRLPDSLKSTAITVTEVGISATSARLSDRLLSDVSLIAMSSGESRSLRFDNADMVVAGSGLIVNKVTRLNGILIANVSAESGTDRPSALHLYREAKRFSPSQSQDVLVTGEAKRPASPTPEPDTTPKVLKTAVTDSLRSGAEGHVYHFTIASEADFSIASGGPSDLIGTLKTEDGATLHSDDDSGDGYNFRIRQRLAPGAYTLTVTHCCNGGGPYEISIDQNR
ncbi:MAG: hypothetical protein HOL85_02360 [Rhodospirillaceae bacterium]|nr:hypothetical protein [Rhodospirillaceae bacterium]